MADVYKIIDAAAAKMEGLLNEAHETHQLLSIYWYTVGERAHGVATLVAKRELPRQVLATPAPAGAFNPFR